MKKIIIKADKNGIPTEIKMSAYQAEMIYYFMDGLRIGLLRSEEMAEDLIYEIKEELGKSEIKIDNIKFQKPNSQITSAYIVREKYANKEGSDDVVDYEQLYNLLVKEIKKLTGKKIDMKNTIVYDK